MICDFSFPLFFLIMPSLFSVNVLEYFLWLSLMVITRTIKRLVSETMYYLLSGIVKSACSLSY